MVCGVRNVGVCLVNLICTMERSLREEYEVKEIWTMGETICEIMRPEVDMPLERTGEFTGPFPSAVVVIMEAT